MNDQEAEVGLYVAHYMPSGKNRMLLFGPSGEKQRDVNLEELRETVGERAIAKITANLRLEIVDWRNAMRCNDQNLRASHLAVLLEIHYQHPFIVFSEDEKILELSEARYGEFPQFFNNSPAATLIPDFDVILEIPREANQPLQRLPLIQSRLLDQH